jgi:hypothetical protein
MEAKATFRQGMRRAVMNCLEASYIKKEYKKPNLPRSLWLLHYSLND